MIVFKFEIFKFSFPLFSLVSVLNFRGNEVLSFNSQSDDIVLSLKWTDIRFSLSRTNLKNLASSKLPSEFIWFLYLKPLLLPRFDKQKHSAVCQGRDCDTGYRPVDMDTWTMAACPTCQFSNTSEDAKLLERYKVSFREALA